MTDGKRRLVLLVIVFAFTAMGVRRSSGEEFYKDKYLKFIVGASAGGSFDTYTRLIARHMGRHVPGDPTTVVQNMPGAGSLIAANYIFNKVKRDGLTIGGFAAALVLQDVMGNKAVKFDGRKFGWIGIPSFYHTLCSFRSDSNIKTVEDWRAAKHPVKLSGIGPGAGPSDIPRLLHAALGLPVHLVEGYRGGAQARLALERGEVEGYCGSWEAVKSVWSRPLKTGEITLVLQANLESHPELKEVPLAIDFAKTDEQRRILGVADTTHGIEFVYAVAPGTPQNRLETLQKAFIETLNDPALREEARRSGLEIAPMDGTTLGKRLSALYDLPPETVEKLREILIPKG
jgi:tripartite-type tricarboxylate transporter receptor subunit TctC